MRTAVLTTALFVMGALVAAPQVEGQVGVKMEGVSDASLVNGVYVGPYTMSIPGMGTMDVFCIDFLNTVSVNQTWTAHVSQLTLGGLDNTRHGNAAFEQYHRAAWLVTQFGGAAKSEWGAIHAAIWVTMLPPDMVDTDGLPTLAAPHKLQVGNWGGWGWVTDEATQVGKWLALAEENYSDLSTSGFRIITDVTSIDPETGGMAVGGAQEFITIVPEPGTMLLLGTGLLATLGVARARRRREDEDAVADALTPEDEVA